MGIEGYSSSKKPCFENYLAWHHKFVEPEHKLDLFSSYYSSVLDTVLWQFKSSQFWSEITKQLPYCATEFYHNTGYSLLLNPTDNPEVLTKSFKSLLNKIYRKNILLNYAYPSEPEQGWITSQNCFEKINDIIRTRITVKYLDGVDFLIDKFFSISKSNGLIQTCSYEAKEDGYYAVHLYIEMPYELINWKTLQLQSYKIRTEIQITTQLQEVITTLIHKLYESSRLKPKITSKSDRIWQWNYSSNSFKMNYIGHVLHFMEGTIMELRNKKGDDYE